MKINYVLSPKLKTEEFIDILNRSNLALRRPVDDKACIKGMLEHADVIVIAKLDEKIVGVARSVTDFNYCCYLCDLAVDEEFQAQGIGKKLIEKTQEALNEKCKIILLSAPAAKEYYPKIGFTQHYSAWTLAPTPN